MRVNLRWLYAWPLAIVMLVLYILAAPAHRRMHRHEHD